jgi:TorA maturation chaperone TorD
MKGMSPITNPTIAVVKVRYETFVDSYKFQKTLQKSSERALLDLNDQRRIADNIITQIWNEVEAAYGELPEDIRRDKAADYGVVYVFRKNELPGLSVLQNVQLSLI